MANALGPEVPCRIIELYLKDAPTRVAEIRQTLASGDARASEAAAHSLRGSSANLGAVALAERCHQLEQHAATLTPAEAEARLAELENELREVEKAMRQLVTELA